MSANDEASELFLGQYKFTAEIRIELACVAAIRTAARLTRALRWVSVDPSRHSACRLCMFTLQPGL